ncbi:MAG: adenylate/guanylate cyclase domain-containing protein, partial [Candidatus Sericytochromatia bacterium]|nr:adenylate/guanylate cyclase domain-containing protein [Candidatus Sericytochromatia bacterium]
VGALGYIKESLALERVQREREDAEMTRRVALVMKTSATERELEISSRLLEGTLPAPIVTELKRNGRVQPVVHESTTVLFTDLVGFTRVAERFGPEVLVDSLDELFGAFDAISARWGVEKIKTIGDAYMACAGIPLPHPHHALAATMAALEMREVVRATGRTADDKRPEWGIRIGLHTGPVLAGIIGKTKLAYDIWGDSVNTAARMESSGQPDHINVSATVAALIEPWFVLQQRGLVAAKNKGDLEMAFVMGLKPEYAQDPHGLVPTEAFVALVRGEA